MKIRVFFIDENNSSKQNGIGTFRELLLGRLCKYGQLEVNLVSLNADVDNLMIRTTVYGREYAFPFVGRGNWRELGSVICPILKLYVEDGNYNVFLINHSPSDRFICVLKKLFPKSKVISVIHDFGWCEYLYGSPELLRRIRKGRKPKKLSEEIASYVCSYFEKEKRVYDMVDAVVSLSPSSTDILKSIYQVPPNKIAEIPNGYMAKAATPIQRVKARERLGIPMSTKLMLFIGRPTQYKGIIPLLKAIKIVRKQYPEIRCALIGSFHIYMDYWAFGKDVAANLICTGRLTQKELELWYAAADVGVIPSYSEQCSFVGLEMKRASMVIVSSDANGLCDMFEDEETAFVAPIGNIWNIGSYTKEIANAIDKAFHVSPSQKKKMLSNNRQHLLERFSADSMSEKYYKLFCRIIPM